MITRKFSCPGSVVAASVLITLLSCHYQSGDIAFPEKESGYAQPITVPLQFGPAKKLNWDTVKTGGINHQVKKLDIDALPSVAYDSTGFKPFTKPPEESGFNFSSLPESAFSLDNLPSTALQFKTTALPPAPGFTALKPTLQKGNAASIFDFGQIHGLQAKFITCLLKDKSGLMWIASTEGLFRFDGERIQTFMPPSGNIGIAGMAEDNDGRIWFIKESGLGLIDLHRGSIGYTGQIGAARNDISKMITDENGLIWVTNTKDKSVIIINPKTRSFKSLDTKAGLSDSSGAVSIIKDDNKNIWITTNKDGANIINLATGSIKKLGKTNGLAGDSLRAITKDNAGRIWISLLRGGLDAVDLKHGTIKHYSEAQGLRRSFTIALSGDNKGRIWMGTNKGIALIDPENGMIKFFDQNSGLGGNLVTSLVTDSYNRMWVSTIEGLNIIEQNGETVYPLGKTPVITMMEDNQGNIWVGTDKGIVIMDPKKNVLRMLNKSNGLGNDFIQSFMKTDGNIWATSNGGIDIIDPISKTIEHTGKKEGLVNDTIYVVLKDNTGNTWLTGPDNGIDQIDSAKKTIRHTGVNGGLSSNNILDVKQDINGLVWLATNNRGINVVDPVAGTVKYLDNLPGLKDTCFRILLPDKAGRMWIGTDKGIYVADAKQGTITTISTTEGLPNNRILSLLEYNGKVIAGTNNKISIITPPAANTGTDAKTGNDLWQVSLLNNSAALLRQQTNAWSTDLVTKNGRYLWGDRGITLISDIKSATDSTATYVTGMSVMTKLRYFADARSTAQNDTLWMGGNFYLDGKMPPGSGYASVDELKWDSVSGPYNMPVNLQLSHNQNYIQFQFAQANLSRQDTTWYRYVLEGIDKNWSAVTTNPFTENYLNLPHGKYTFKVSSKGISGKWGDAATFSFTIAPPWYQTWWAYTLLTLLGLLLLRGFIVYRSRKLQDENRLLEEKVTLRTNQLQKSLEDLKATQEQLIQSEKMASLGELTAGIAHEIQNPLNFINNFSEVNTELIEEMKAAIDKGNLEEVNALAADIVANEQKINHHGKRADAIVKGMLQHSRSSSAVKEPTDINKLADEYLRLAYHGLRAKDKTFNATLKTDYDESIGSINIVPQDIGRVILNLITNAFYAVAEKKKNAATPQNAGNNPGGSDHLQKHYEPTVAVSTKKMGDVVMIRVKDNGNGIPQKVLDKIFQPFFTTKPTGQGTGLGLSLAYDIVKAHGGELRVETKVGEGTELIIQIPNSL